MELCTSYRYAFVIMLAMVEKNKSTLTDIMRFIYFELQLPGTQSGILKNLNMLVKIGLLERDKNKYYSLTEKGRKEAEWAKKVYEYLLKIT